MFQGLGMEKKELHLRVFSPFDKTADVGPTFLEVPSPCLCTPFLSELSPLGAAGDTLTRYFKGSSDGGFLAWCTVTQGYVCAW